MSLLLAADAVVLFPPSENTDEHGWREPGTEPYWEGIGNLQLGPGLSNPLASAGGGRGPYGPARDNVGALFLPPDVILLEGSIADVRGRRYVLSQTRMVNDPANPVAGTLSCWAATATSVDTWPAGGQR